MSDAPMVRVMLSSLPMRSQLFTVVSVAASARLAKPAAGRAMASVRPPAPPRKSRRLISACRSCTRVSWVVMVWVSLFTGRRRLA